MTEMDSTVFLATAVLASISACLYLALLSRRLHGPHPASNPQSVFSDEELANVAYDDIDMLNAIPSKPTLANYVIVGGSGYLGTYVFKQRPRNVYIGLKHGFCSYIIRLLLLRGETSIRILDLHPPHPDIASNSAVSFFRTDITSLQSVRDGLLRSFPEVPASSSSTVIYHTAAIIRFWERARYTWPLSHSVNVQGTANVLSVAKTIPNAILIYTSSSETAIPCAKFLRLGWDYKTPPWHKVSISDNDPPLTPSQGIESCYARSKILAERLVIGANGWSGLKTGIIRPGRCDFYFT